MRINTLVTLGASAAFGVMSIILARGWINDAVSARYAGAPSGPALTAPASVNTVPVVVADIDLNFGDRLDPQNLRIVDMPVDAVPAGSFSSFSFMLGDAQAPAVVLTAVRANEPVLDNKISGPGGRGSLSAVIKEGYRAASIRVNAVAGVAGFVLPGDHVDVILTRDTATGDQARKLTSDIILQNIKVLGADQNADQTAADVQVVGTVTLEVIPADAQKLVLAMDIGSLSLTLRQSGETVITPVASLTEKSLMRAQTAHAPTRNYYKRPAVKKADALPAPAAGVPTAKVNIIRSGERESVSVRKEVIGRQSAAPQMAGGAKG